MPRPVYRLPFCLPCSCSSSAPRAPRRSRRRARSTGSSSARSAPHRQPAASTTSPCSNRTRRSSTWPRRPGGVWKTDEPRHDVHGRVRPRGDLVGRRYRHRADATPTSSGWAPARTTTARARRGATASTSPTDGGAHVEEHGPARRHSRSPASSSTPSTHDVVYVAALGGSVGPGGDRGVYKTTDGGLTWTHVAADRRRHRRHRAGDGSREQQGALRRHLPASARGLGHERRRSGQRHLEVDRRRPHVDDARRRASRTARRAASASTSIARIPNVLYARIEHETESGVYRSRRRRR